MTENTKKLVGKVALVTGGSRGLGAEIARALAEEGADVAVSYVSSAEKAPAVVRDIEKKTGLGVRAAGVPAAQGDPSQTQGLIQYVLAPFAHPDISANNDAEALPETTTDP